MAQDMAHLRYDRYDRFPWTRFYEAMADRLLDVRDQRDELIGEINTIADTKGVSGPPVKDICPFSVLGLFNRARKATAKKRQEIAYELANLLDVSVAVPDSFKGIPCYPWLFFDPESKCQADDIDVLWEVFAQAITFTQVDDTARRSSFVAAYDDAIRINWVKWNLTIGLHWVRPWRFPTLDTLSRQYIQEDLDIQICTNAPKRCCSASDYLAVRGVLATQFQEAACPVHSFPELALAAGI